MDVFKSLREVKEGCKALRGGFARDTIFIARTFPFICGQLAETNQKLEKISRQLELLLKQQKKKQKKRKLSAFNLFIAEKCKGGKVSLQEAVKLWKKQKKR